MSCNCDIRLSSTALNKHKLNLPSVKRVKRRSVVPLLDAKVISRFWYCQVFGKIFILTTRVFLWHQINIRCLNIFGIASAFRLFNICHNDIKLVNAVVSRFLSFRFPTILKKIHSISAIGTLYKHWVYIYVYSIS